MPEDHELAERWVNAIARDPVNGLSERRRGKGYVDAGTSPPVWAKTLLTTFQVPSMRASWK